ncbi:MAG: FAD-dependent oxidoreductase [Candidatus Eisenbacteria bacterium]|nr:FAD-dependent oxidoreductase [Candidatus Eisenbacteria bacterium]
MQYRYVIVGGGLAAASAIEGIRSRDREGGILLFSRENHLPYRRSPLSKDAWTPGFDLGALAVHPDSYYDEMQVEVRLRREVVELDPDSRVLWDERGESVGFDELLFATGCRPRRLHAEGAAESPSVRYYRDLEDFLDLQRRIEQLQHATVVGGGFVAVELAGTLRARGLQVTLVFPEEWPLYRQLPRSLGTGLVEVLRDMGVEIVSGETLVRIHEAHGFVQARTYGGNDLTTQLVVVDQGSEAQVELADAAGLDTDDGIVVDEHGRASKPHTWAAGDVAEFPYLALGQLMRVEGADHAGQHGRLVGENMAGADRTYDHLPLKGFQIGSLRFEGVGELSSRLDSDEVWPEPGREGVIFYLRDDVVRGVLLCNVPDRLEWARDLIRAAKPMSAAERAALLPVKA